MLSLVNIVLKLRTLRLGGKKEKERKNADIMSQKVLLLCFTSELPDNQNKNDNRIIRWFLHTHEDKP